MRIIILFFAILKVISVSGQVSENTYSHSEKDGDSQIKCPEIKVVVETSFIRRVWGRDDASQHKRYINDSLISSSTFYGDIPVFEEIYIEGYKRSLAISHDEKGQLKYIGELCYGKLHGQLKYYLRSKKLGAIYLFEEGQFKEVLYARKKSLRKVDKDFAPIRIYMKPQ